MKEINVPIVGMHCRSCEVMITDKIQKIHGVQSVSVNLKKKEAVITSSEPIRLERVARAVQEAGYEVGVKKEPFVSTDIANWRDVIISAVLVAILFFVLSRTGLGEINTGSVASQGVIVALFVGLTAGLSTCMALVGGLVLGMSARHTEKHPEASRIQKFRPHLFFNGSRIVSFFILGGLIGLFGSVLQLSGVALGIAMIFVGIVMFLLGLQLTSIFPRLSNGGLALPAGIAKKLSINNDTNAEYSHKSTVLLGTASFFLPCGFTQAMQLYAMSTGSFTTGALVMGLFALGTTPGLLGVGGLTSVVKGEFAQRFFRFAGVVVIALAAVNINSGLTMTGWRNTLALRSTSNVQDAQPPGFVAPKEESSPANKNDVPKENILKATFSIPDNAPMLGLIGDIHPNTFTIRSGESYTLQVDAKDDGVGCMSTIMIPGLVNQPQFLQAGTVHELTFKAEKPGVYRIACAMGVPFGNISVL